MLIYFIAYGLMVLAALKRSKQGVNGKQKRFYCLFFAILWVGILGLRHPSMGIDLQYGSAYGYLGRFEYIADTSWAELFAYGVSNFEYGYLIFCKLLGYFGTDYQLFLFVCAVIPIGAVTWWIYKNSDYPFMSSVIFLGLPFFAINYSGLRQALAIAITTISMECINNRKPMRFVILVMLAAAFHSSAWIFLVAYPLYYIKLNKKASIITLLLPPLTFACRKPLFLALSRLFVESVNSDNNGSVALFVAFLAIYFFVVVFGTQKDQQENGLRNLFLVVCIVQSMAGMYNSAIRVGYYFMPSLIILLPRIIYNRLNAASIREGINWRGYQDMTIFSVIICVGFILFGWYLLSSTSWAMSNPYIFHWQ